MDAAQVQVIDLISLKPFDMEAITNSVRKTRRVIIVEECMKTGGIGASLSAAINEALFDELDHQVHQHVPLRLQSVSWTSPEATSCIILMQLGWSTCSRLLHTIQ